MNNFLKISLLYLVCTGCHSRNHRSEINKEDSSALSRPAETLDTQVTAKPKPLVDSSLAIEYFPAIPDTIDGCGEYFSNLTDEVRKDKYIFLSNLSEFAMIRIKGKNIFLQKNSKESKEIDDKTYIAVYEGEGYKAILNMRQTKAYDEGGFYTGNLEISKDGKRSVIAVHGEAGC